MAHNHDQKIFDLAMTATGELDRLFGITELYLVNALRILLKISAPASRAIYYALDAWPARKAVLTRVAKAIGDEVEIGLVSRLTEAAEKANDQRKQVAHGILLFGIPGTQQSRILKTKTGTTLTITEGFLNALKEKSMAAFHEAQKAYLDLANKLGQDGVVLWEGAIMQEQP
jgi:hypothetical protein